MLTASLRRLGESEISVTEVFRGMSLKLAMLLHAAPHEFQWLRNCNYYYWRNDNFTQKLDAWTQMREYFRKKYSLMFYPGTDEYRTLLKWDLEDAENF